jgi:hypothetical protein
MDKNHLRRQRQAVICLVIMMLSALCGGVASQIVATGLEPSHRPVLCIETGMHTARINRIAVDATK